MKDILLIILSVSIIMVSFAGCGKNNSTNTQVQPSSKIAEDDNQTKIFTEVGIYTGRIDNNSIEVKVNDEPKAFRLSEKVKNEFESYNLKAGQMTNIKYSLNNYKQPVVEKIDILIE